MRRQAGRYAIAGVITAVVSIGSVLALTGVVGVQVAILASYPLVLAVHFSLQRWFVFAHGGTGGEYALDGGAQLRRYLMTVAAQYCYVAACTALLMSAIGMGDRIAYLAAVLSGTALVFAVMRLRIFHGT
jgi:putative flippase GtrA